MPSLSNFCRFWQDRGRVTGEILRLSGRLGFIVASQTKCFWAFGTNDVAVFDESKIDLPPRALAEIERKLQFIGEGFALRTSMVLLLFVTTLTIRVNCVWNPTSLNAVSWHYFNCKRMQETLQTIRSYAGIGLIGEAAGFSSKIMLMALEIDDRALYVVSSMILQLWEWFALLLTCIFLLWFVRLFK